MRDYCGKTIHVGDTIVYPGRTRSEMWLTHGVVRKVDVWSLIIEKESGRMVEFTSTNRCVVI